jgi:Ca2+-binding RTX toxin-like protein
MDGGLGIDSLRGGAGSDVYLFRFEEDAPNLSQMTTIIDADNGNTMRFPDGISLNEVRAIRSGNDVLIEFGASKVRIQDGNIRAVIDKFDFYDRSVPAGLNDLPSTRVGMTLVPSINDTAQAANLQDGGCLQAAIVLAMICG